MSDIGPRRTRRSSRLLPAGVLLVLICVSVGSFVISRGVVDDQEVRLLKERTAEVAALLSNSTANLQPTLQVLGALGLSPDAPGRGSFAQGAAPLIAGGAAGVAVVADRGDGFAVVAAAGDAPPPGTKLDPDRAAIAQRAGAASRLVAGLLGDPKHRRLVIAVPLPGAARSAAYQETPVNPTTPIPPTPGSPFHELRVALYAAGTNDPERLVLTTEARVPLTGRVERVPFNLGADRWTLAVGARGHLVGSFAERFPWILLGVGLVTALLAAAAVEVLTRRRTYALALVADRTAELEQTRRFQEHLLTAGPVVVRRVRFPERSVSYVSPNIERLLGVTPDQALAPDGLATFVHPDDWSGLSAALERVAAGSSTREVVEYRFGRLGEFRAVSSVLVPETDEEGRIVAVLSYLLDVDDRRRAEDAQRVAQEAADAANRSKSEFLSRMSHELRTPLNAVLGFGQLLELEELSHEQRESVDQILKGGRHLLDLINEVMDISRIEAGELALSPEAVLASELVHETVDLIRSLANQRSIRLVVDSSGLCDCYVFADRQRTKQVLLNLLSNAVKYNRPRGTVAVTCEQPSSTRVAIKVADTGPGIATERLGLLFAPFERLGAEDTDVEGTGIGLALSQRLTAAMGGTLGVTSALGQGSTFTVDLPRVEGPVERYERLGPVESATTRRDTRLKVLHIEDNLSNLKLVERILARRADIEIVAAMHGGLGLELAREQRPILILLDLHLPDMGGEDVLQRLRDDPVTASIPVAIISADATAGQVQRLLASGATAYLTKPIDVRELLTILDQALKGLET